LIGPDQSGRPRHGGGGDEAIPLIGVEFG